MLLKLLCKSITQFKAISTTAENILGLHCRCQEATYLHLIVILTMFESIWFTRSCKAEEAEAVLSGSRSGSLHWGRGAAKLGCGCVVNSRGDTRRHSRHTGSTAQCPAAGDDSEPLHTAPLPEPPPPLHLQRMMRRRRRKRRSWKRMMKREAAGKSVAEGVF